MARLTPFLFTQNLSVDNALSTIQVIHQLIAKMNGLVDYINNMENISNEYTDNEINKLNVDLREVINSVKNELNNSLNNLDNKLKAEININSDNIALINDDIIELNNNFDNLANDLELNKALTISNYNTLIATISQLKIYVDELIKAMTVKVYSCTTGTKKDIQSALIDIYNLYSLNIGNATVKYIKKLFAELPNIDTRDSTNQFNVRVDVKFSIIQKIIDDYTSTKYAYLQLKDTTNVMNQFVLYLKLKSAIQYALYEMIYIISLAYTLKDADTSISNASEKVTGVMYQTLGYGYTKYLPLSFAWYDSL